MDYLGARTRTSNGAETLVEWHPQESQAVEPVQRQKVERKRVTVYLPLELIERTRNIVYWTDHLTLARFVQEALAESVEKREREHGCAFPKRLSELKGGRPKRKR
ncbi:MAG: hypothetical protein C4293_08365 [Nitrospiraceae bacterium]